MDKELTSVQAFLIQKYNVYFPIEKDIRILIYAQLGCYILFRKYRTYYLFKLSDVATDLISYYNVGLIEDQNDLKEHIISSMDGECYYKTISKDMLLQWIETNS